MDEPTHTIAAGDAARRASILRVVAGVFAVLGAVVTTQTLVVGGPPVVWLAVLVASAIFGVVAAWVSRPERRAVGNALFFVTILLEHVATSVPNAEPADAATVLYFTGLVPMIAAFTGGRATVALVSGGAFATAMVCLAVSGLRGLPIDVVLRAYAPGVTFVITTILLGNLTAWASSRSLAAQVADGEERERLRQAARDASERFLRVTDHVSDLVATFDPCGRYTFASGSYERILGLSPSDLIGTRTPDAILAEDGGLVTAAFQAAVRDGSGEIVARLRATSGEIRVFHLRFVRAGPAGAVEIAMAGRDITDVQRLAADLESARRMESLGRVAGGVAHDFNNLLAVVSSANSLAKDQLEDDHPARADLRFIDDAVDRAARLTHQLLAFARRQVMPRSHACPAVVVGELAPLLQKAAGNTHVAVQIEGRAQTAATSTQLEQVVLNLIVNARDARARRVVVRVADVTVTEGDPGKLKPGPYARIEVVDDGEGMSDEAKTRLFEPFYTTKAPGKGSGLGLATAFGIATQHGGAMTVESTLGVGTTFRVWLPQVTPTADVASAPVASSAARRRVLVVDDDPAFGALVYRMLDSAGHDATVTTNGSDAVTAAGQGRYDVVMSDVVLGSEDGIALLGQLHTLQPEARVVLMSGFAPRPERIAALGDEIGAVLAKPFSPDALRHALSA